MRYVAIRSEGGLIPYDLLDKIASEDAAGQKPGDFGLPKGRRLTDEISRVWADAQSLWSNFKRRRESLGDRDPYGTSITRSWIGLLLGDVDMLGFDLKLQASAVVVNNSTYAISHRSGEGEDAIPVHIEGLKIDLDRRLHTKLRTSPQAMVQDFLNNNEPTVWGIVTNGLGLRILRNSSRTSRPTYLEFDLENIFDGNRFNEFGLFYRVCHRSRFPMPGRDLAECLLERYYLDSIEQGLRVREKLREGVEETLKILGTGLLQHPENNTLREKVSSRQLSAVQFHRQLLLLVYRLLFLMVAEERRLIVALGENAEQNQNIYDEWYSISRLRDRAAQIIDASPFGDVWQGLQQTFSLFEYGLDTNALGIPPLNGDLFHQEHAIPDLKGAELHNHQLLRAIRHLSLFKDGSVQQRVNYSALDVEELGSVYESLLDYQPVLQPTDKGVVFELRAGMERKSTGSYYTRPELVHELVESALVPVMQDVIAEAEKASEGKNLVEEQKAKIAAILNMTVCDPACGSGHFLLAAARRLGKELARVRTGEDEPKPEDFHLAVRDVIAHSVYGVDLNPLAVDLCKLALWLEGHWAGKPLSFLDHRIRCGNSLVGVLDPDVLADGIPDEAFAAVTGDDRKVASAFKKRNKQERTSKQRGFSFESDDHSGEYAKSKRELAEIEEDTASAVRRKAELYSSWRTGMQLAHDEAIADLWTAQFSNVMKSIDDPEVCTTGPFLDFAKDGAKQPQRVAAARVRAMQNRYFQWHLEFSEVFAKGGFNVVLGNPPWERIKLQEEEHWIDDEYISLARNKAERTKRIDEYRNSLDLVKQARIARFDQAKHESEAIGKFVRHSGRFPLTSSGDINTYALFAELARTILSSKGRAGIIVPTGIATDDTYKEFFGDLNGQDAIVSIFDFENRDHLFPAVYYRMKFCLFTFAKGKIQVSSFAFYLTRPEQVRDEVRRFQFSAADMKLVNPNTRTCPVFRTRIDAELTKKLYRQVPILDDFASGGDRWTVRFIRMFDMANDSGMFHQEDGPDFAPLYEGKMLQAYDHRAASIVLHSGNVNRDAQPQLTTPVQYDDPSYLPMPRYWVKASDVDDRLGEWKAEWFICFKDVASTTNESTCIFTVLPRVGVGHTVPVVVFDTPWTAVQIACLLANFNSLVVDYLARQKLGGLHLTFTFLRQLPIVPPGNYTEADCAFISNSVLELTYTAHDLSEFASDLGFKGELFRWDASRRAECSAELDAYFAHMYRLSRDELSYLLDPVSIFGPDFPGETFRILREREVAECGEYRTQRLVLKAFDDLARSERFAGDMATRESAIQRS
jgi:hypothetical protein